MRRIFKIAGIAISSLALFSLVLIILIAGALYHLGSTEPDPGSFTHEVEYTAEFQANSTLNNAAFILPYPDSRKFEKAIEEGSSENISIRNEANASLSLVNTSHGEMLQLDLGNFTPEVSSYEGYEQLNDTEEGEEIVRGRINRSNFDSYDSYDLVIRIDYNRSLDTRNGLETEPNLPANRTQTYPCDHPGEPECFNSTTQAFLSYETSNNTYLDINVGLEGRNSWWDLGWSGNTYHQKFYNSFYDDSHIIGSQNQWITLTGREAQGDGVYRD